MDPATGYRYYALDQLPRARLVARLRRLGLPLARIGFLADLTPQARALELRGWLHSQRKRLRVKLMPGKGNSLEIGVAGLIVGWHWYFASVRLGVYIDAFNLYYGGKSFFGPGTHGWKWLDVRDLVAKIVSCRPDWPGATITRIVYCTALIDQATNPSGYIEQDVYLKALQTRRSVDLIEYGYYVSRVKYAPLAVPGQNRVPQLVKPAWPIMIQDGN